MTKFTQKTGLSTIHIGTYITIIGLLLTMFGSVLMYIKEDSIWKTQMYNKVDLLIKDGIDQRVYNNNIIGKLDSIGCNVLRQEGQIKFLKTTKQNKKVLTPVEYQDLSINLNK